MTQKDALELALKELGGRAHLQDIYPIALKYITHKEGSKIYDSLRGCMHDKRRFRPSPGMPTGWYELISFQEDIARRDRRIAELEALLAAMNDEIARCKDVPTEDNFVKKFVEETKHFFKHDRKKADTVRQIMIKVGRSDADKELDSWIEGKQQPSTALALEKQTEALLKAVERPTTQNIHGSYFAGDKVAEKTVIPNVNNYKPQIENQINDGPKLPLGQKDKKTHKDE